MPGAEWILAAYIGSAYTLSAPLEITQPATGTALTLVNVDYEGRSFTPLFIMGTECQRSRAQGRLASRRNSLT